MSFLVMGSSKRRPIRRLIANRVLSGLVTAWRLAGWPINRSPSFVKATIDGVVRAPSEFSITLGFPPSITATQELVVPRSIPITFAIFLPSVFYSWTPDFRISTRAKPVVGSRELLCYTGDIGVDSLGTRDRAR